ncbi:MAG: hypothetical protein PHT37_02475 [Candidatus Cloacimonetes bacterium]|jgi:hypothetical protein|nr:hypothetical protein [Candidatus Cloacimonadota bacterium]MDY0326061.1 hypothetical protein [Candidatus Cloacimonadaceae bacterium]
MTQEEQARKLRQEIHRLRVKKFHWPLDAFKFIMDGMGYGSSLTALSEDRLRELKALMLKYRKHGRPNEFTFDKQGKYMFLLMKQAGWTESQFRAFTIKHYSKSHWNLLDPKERRAVIAMFQSYLNKQANQQDQQNTAIDPKEDSNE